MMKHITDFNRLSPEERFSHISAFGKYIGFRMNCNHVIQLYLMDDTFFEVWCFPPEDSIVKVEPLDDLNKIDLYINYMNELVIRA